MNEARTQKARGVLWLQRKGYDVPELVVWIGNERPESRYPAFARPCPVTPRHGFVESRVVNTEAEAEAVLAEARAADPEAELMLMRPIGADLSAVVTPRMAAVGRGNDGATAGAAGVLNFPLTHVSVPAPPELIPYDQAPYLEVVYQSGYAFPVQLRSGPQLSAGTGSFVPRAVTVAHVIDAHAVSPLELEAALAVAPEGTVVWQANGSPCSHAACHARLNDVAIVFDAAEPAIGTTLAPTGDERTLDADTFRASVQSLGSIRAPHLKPSHIWAVHQSLDLGSTAEGARFLAQSLVSIWGHAAAACVAEARHSLFDKKGRRKRRRSGSRDGYYQRLLAKRVTDASLRGRVKASAILFEHSNYWACGFGGSAWHGCAIATLRLYDALAAASALNAGLPEMRAAISAAHDVVNSAHNNGPFLDKFVSGDAFDHAAAGMLNLALRSLRDMATAAYAPIISVPAVWPKRRPGRAPLEGKTLSFADMVQSLQWNLRQDGTLLHAQYGMRGDYKSATMPLALLSAPQRALISILTRSRPAHLPSMAASDTLYWAAEHIIDVETARSLFPSLRIV